MGGVFVGNLWDMRRFFEGFEIPQPTAVDWGRLQFTAGGCGIAIDLPAGGWQIPFPGIAAASGCRGPANASWWISPNTITSDGHTTGFFLVSAMSGSGDFTLSKPASNGGPNENYSGRSPEPCLSGWHCRATPARWSSWKSKRGPGNRALPRSVQGPVFAGFPWVDRRVFGERSGSGHRQ